MDIQSLTSVTRADLDLALANHEAMKRLHEAKHTAMVKLWAEGKKFTWWQRHVKKLHLLQPRELLRYYRDNEWGWFYEDYMMREGLWEEDFNFTLGRRGSKWKDITERLASSQRDEHLVSDGVLDWISHWKNITVPQNWLDESV